MSTKRRGGRSRPTTSGTPRSHSYRQLQHPFTPQAIFSEDGVARIHEMALRVVQDLGIKILLPEARQIFEAAGALVDHDTQIVRIGSDLVEAALATTPTSYRLRGRSVLRDQMFKDGSMLFAPGAGCPNVTDLVRGRRAGSLETYEETIKLQQSFDVMHVFGPSAEPQDVAPALRHYEIMRIQMECGDKPNFVYARGRGQVAQSFEMIQLGNDMGAQAFDDDVWCFTVINTNSPRQLDVPMAEGIIDFARANQLSIITPFCLAGAMAPITISGALVLQHAECLAAITLAQLARPGAPVAYGGFSSNVDMKSGSPAFGTPEHIKLSIGSGQLARHIGLPWRSATGAASNTNDMQAATETNMALWAQLQANATLTVHSAGWLEGGLTFGYEKFINDIEALQTIAELCQTTPEDAESLGWSALSEVEPGGHFFATQHTMDRYKTAFYEPLVSDLRNHGAWRDDGAKSSAERATKIWQNTLRDFKAPHDSTAVADRLAAYIERGKAKGGAAPADG
jgi:trimethylamine--corrinoid protein Co-methyltransferase